MIQRRHFGALIALIVLGVAAAAFLVWRAWDRDAEGSLSDPIAATGTFTPQQHLFGDPIRARIDVVLDAKEVAPESVKLNVKFAPYRTLHPPTRTESTAGPVTRIRYLYDLACLGYRCLPVGQRRFDLRSASVEYRTASGGAGETIEIDWPTVYAAGRIPAARLWEARLRADYRDLGEPTYRVSPGLVQVVAIVLAALFAAAGLILLARLLPLVRWAERLGLKTVDTRTPLERALARVHETADRPDEGRRALDRLALELRRAREPELALVASRLAWSREFPLDGRLTTLSGEVERRIGEAPA